jgi:hypothetical protein
MRGEDELTRAPEFVAWTKDLIKARRLLGTDNLAFVLVRKGSVIARGTSGGVGELLAAVDKLGAQTRGASLADKVVGKAVALIVVSAGICAVDTPLASRAAARVLRSHSVALHATSIVQQIMNRRGDAPCPMEQLTRPFDEPSAAIAKLREFLAGRRPMPILQPASLSRSRTAAKNGRPG